MLGRDDFDTFYDPDEFARVFTLRAGEPDEIRFAAIFSVVDAVGLQGLVVDGDYALSYPSESVALRKGDVLTETASGEQWQVREHPKRIVDGLESVVPLARYSAAP